MKSTRVRGICRHCGDSYQLYSSRSEPAYDCQCGRNSFREQPEPLADETNSDARELARERD